MLHMYTKFDIFVRSSVITKNVFFSLIKEYRETSLRSLCEVIDNFITMKIVFFLHNLVLSFYFCCQFEAVTFSRWLPFWGRHEIFTGSDTEIWICYKYSHEHLWNFELLIDALVEILTELLQFKVLTYFRTLWRHQWSTSRSFVKAYSQFNDI